MNSAFPNRAEQPPAEPRRPSAAPPPVAPRKPLSAYLTENVAAALSYVFGWISGLILLLVDRRPFVRYHAAQSVVVFAALNLCVLVLGGFFFASFLPSLGAPLLILRRLLELVWIIAAIVLMLKAYSGERYRVAYAATFAERAAGAKE